LSLSAPLAFVLIAAGLWSIIVWPPFLKRVLKAPEARDANGAPTRFMTVNLMLISTAIIFGLATTIIGVRALAA